MKQLKAIIEDKIHHTYLKKHIRNPVIDEEKLFMLCAVFHDAAMPLFKKEQYIITTMLVQIALDTHDIVPVNDEIRDEADRFSMQLTVLAGDYYSGLYYLLLSEMQAFDMIHILASAIKEINEYKMKRYEDGASSFDCLIDNFKKTESLLIQRIAEYINEPELNIIIEEWLITNKLIKEKSTSSVDEFWRWFSNSDSDPDSIISAKIENVIERKINRIGNAASQLPDQYSMFKNHLHLRMEELSECSATIAEEG
jgi:heptaprenyl diphosphate synthase